MGRCGRDRQRLRSLTATRYVTPLREGGSLPGLVEADDDGLYVTKFRGAGRGPRALVAEVIVGELARRLGLLIPELVTVEIDPRFAAAEPDPEIQDLILASWCPGWSAASASTSASSCSAASMASSAYGLRWTEPGWPRWFRMSRPSR